MSDPVPTCSLNLRDNTSSIQVNAMQELLVLDEQVIPDPAVNMLLNPSLNPFGTDWSTLGGGFTQIVGGGVQLVVSSAPVGVIAGLFQLTPFNSVIPGQTYIFSIYLQGTSVVNLQLEIQISAPGSLSQTFPIANGLNRYSFAITIPSNGIQAQVAFIIIASNATNSGTVDCTQLQFEPEWFPTLSYPTPWVGPAQTNCVQLPLGYWIRQYRKFAGFVTHKTAGTYIGSVRTLQINAVGYAWLMGTIIVNDAYTSKTDSFIIADQLSKYLTSNGTAMLTTINVIQSVTLSALQANWDDMRTLFDNLASQSSSYWTVDAYWNMIYAPPGYFSMMISLICDNSSTPNLVTTFPAYNFSAEMDYTQPGSTILVIGSGSNVAKIVDPSTTAQNGIISGYILPTGNSFMRKINESSLQSVTDCTNRGLAELLQYDYPRNIYHLTANVELIPGYSVQVTSSTDNLNKTSLLVQRVSETWIGMGETLTDTWEYQADLGATNRASTNILSRLFRIANKNTSAPAISTITLASIENLAAIDTASTGTATTGYVPTIQADTPLAYYRLDELSGTIADDISGNANQGTLHGSVTLGVTGLLFSGSDTAMSFDGSTGYISLPTSFVPTGAHAWSIEAWCKPAGLPASPNFTTLVAMGTAASHEKASLLIHNNSGSIKFVLSCFSADITGTTTVNTGTIYHVVGTYDGTNTRLYVNGALEAGPTPFTLNLVATFASIAAENSGAADFLNGTIDEPAFYNYALSAAQISAHYVAGTT